MGAGRFIKQAQCRGNPQGGFDRHMCCCHPRAWGLKKGLRRARRRVDRKVVNEQREG